MPPRVAAERFVGEAGDHLVGVHVRLRAAAGLPDDERELVVVLAVHHGLRGGDDRVGLFVAQRGAVHARGGELHQRERVDDLDRHPFARAEREILDAALGLRAPIGVGGHFDRADRVGFGAGF